MKDVLRTIPETFYEFLGFFIPGFITMELVANSPFVQRTLASSILLTFPVVERTLFFIAGGYVLGHALTMLSDRIIRRPMWRLFGDPSKTLLNWGTALIKPVAKGFDSEFRTILEAETKAVLPTASTDPKVHTLYDLCEQYIKQRDYEMGMLCQKRHALVVLCRNMVVALVIILPFYWYPGLVGLLVIVSAIIAFFLRWNYLCIRRAKFMYHSLHLVAGRGRERASEK